MKETPHLYYKVTSIFINDKLVEIKKDSLLSYNNLKSSYKKRGDKEIYKDYFKNETKAREFIKDVKYGIEDN